MQGWAVKGTRKVTRFNEDQRQYLDNKFQIGQEGGHKADSEIQKVSRNMRYGRRDNGERWRFDVEEFLTAQQIQSYVSSTAGMQSPQSQGMTPTTIMIARRPKNRKPTRLPTQLSFANASCCIPLSMTR